MGIEQAVKLSGIYGITTVMFFMMAFFLGGLIVYVLKQSAKREERLANIIEIHIAQTKTAIDDHDKRAAAAVAVIHEANKYARMEHEGLLESLKVQTKVLSHIANKMGVLIT